MQGDLPDFTLANGLDWTDEPKSKTIGHVIHDTPSMYCMLMKSKAWAYIGRLATTLKGDSKVIKGFAFYAVHSRASMEIHESYLYIL